MKMQCYVYKGANKADYYLYLPHARDDIQAQNLPSTLLVLMGELSLVVEFELNQAKELAQAEAKQVIHDMQTQGFYLQIPTKDMLAEEARWVN